MSESRSYRVRANAEREAAARAQLPRARELHLRSAEVWDGLAEKAELAAHFKRGKIANKSCTQEIKGNRKDSRVRGIRRVAVKTRYSRYAPIATMVD